VITGLDRFSAGQVFGKTILEKNVVMLMRHPRKKRSEAMRKNMRYATVVVVTAALAVCMMSRCVNSRTIIGSYNIGGDAAPGIMTFSPDGTLTWNQPSFSISGTGTWTLIGKHLSITFSGGGIQEGDIQGNPFSFSTYGSMDQYDENGVYIGPGMGTITYSRRLFGLLDALKVTFNGTTKTTNAGGPGATM
jgi:hypothetical protein